MDDTPLDGKNIALLATDGFEDSELSQPHDALRAAGANVTVISDGADTITGEHETVIDVDENVAEVDADIFDALVLPGGVKNPDKLRMNEAAVAFVRSFFDQHKPVAAICHAPWLLIEADVLHDRRLTSWPSLKTDIRNAGGEWVDEEVVVDQGLTTSRKPDDLDAFCAKIIEEFASSEDKEEIII